MEKFMTWMETHMMPVAAKLGNNKYLKAIGSGFIAVMAATIVGSIFTLIGNLPITAWTNWLAETGLNQLFAVQGEIPAIRPVSIRLL